MFPNNNHGKAMPILSEKGVSDTSFYLWSPVCLFVACLFVCLFDCLSLCLFVWFPGGFRSGSITRMWVNINMFFGLLIWRFYRVATFFAVPHSLLRLGLWALSLFGLCIVLTYSSMWGKHRLQGGHLWLQVRGPATEPAPKCEDCSPTSGFFAAGRPARWPPPPKTTTATPAETKKNRRLEKRRTSTAPPPQKPLY